MERPNLFGYWELLSLEDQAAEGSFQSRDYKIIGRLSYIKPDKVFVGLGYYKNTGYASSFYSGDFELNLESSEVMHNVAVSSDEKRNGQTLCRTFSFDGEGNLILTGKNNVGKLVRLKWKRNI